MAMAGFTGRWPSGVGYVPADPCLNCGSRTEWSWAVPTPQACRTEQRDRHICTYYMCVYFRAAQLLGHNWERSKVGNISVSFLGIRDEVGVLPFGKT